MADFKPWEHVDENTVRVADGPTSNPKKITGTRLGAILGLDSWKTPFGAWCEITRVAEEPFEGNKYTEAGNALEPKIIEWCKTNVSPYVYTPEEYYGVKDAKQARRYDFFSSHPVFGGMWDAVVLDDVLGKGKPLGYVEAKTSSRPQDWTDGPPAKYSVQGLTYSHLDALPDVFIVVRFMEPHEYDDPSVCECTDDNTFLYELKVADWSLLLPVPGNDDVIPVRIDSLIEKATAWHAEHVVGNVSPPFDEKRDKVYLDIMRRNEVECDDLEAMAQQAAVLETKIEVIREKNGLDALEKELKTLKEKRLKPALIEQGFPPNKDTVAAYGWQVKRTYPDYIDKDAMQADGVLDKYTKHDKPKDTMTKVKGDK